MLKRVFNSSMKTMSKYLPPAVQMEQHAKALLLESKNDQKPSGDVSFRWRMSGGGYASEKVTVV